MERQFLTMLNRQNPSSFKHRQSKETSECVNLEFLAGADKTETEYKEHGCRFKVDVVKAYFSPRLSTERLRVAKLDVTMR